MHTLKKYLSLIKFSHTIFAMPFALIGFFLGVIKNEPIVNSAPWYIKYGFQLTIVVCCMVFARSAAMAFNRWLDAGLDAQNPRTAVREIPSGIVKANHALWFVILNCIAFIVCCWFLNKLCFYLSFVALFIVLFYSYTKRFTALCHWVLGLGLSLAPIGAYLAVTGTFHLLPVLFSLIVLFWVSGFDIIYALQDEAFDKAHQLYSIPSVLGKKRALLIAVILHVIVAGGIAGAGIYGGFNKWYWMGTSFFIILLIYQHTLVKSTDLSKVNMAFFTTNGIASTIFAAFVLLDLFLN